MKKRRPNSGQKTWPRLLLLIFTMTTILSVRAQNVVTGKIIDSSTNNPLSGAAIQVKNTSIVTSTDEQGNFSINVPNSGSVLDIARVGYGARSVVIANRKDIGIILLSEKTSALEQVVVVGYGTQKRKDVTGSVSIVDVAGVKSQPAASPIEALQGKAQGVQIIND